MKLNQFTDSLQHDKALIFSLNGVIIPADYHITEIKDVNFKTVDCGGKKDQWRETIIQLWNTETIEKNRSAMKADKALSIISKVNQIQALDYSSEIKFEYQKDMNETASIYSLTNIDVLKNKLIVHLGNIPTQCKAADRSHESCCDSARCC